VISNESHYNAAQALRKKKKQAQPQSSRWKEVIKIRAEINERDNVKIQKKSIKQRVGSLKHKQD
jgi:hypothetical protein